MENLIERDKVGIDIHRDSPLTDAGQNYLCAINILHNYKYIINPSASYVDRVLNDRLLQRLYLHSSNLRSCFVLETGIERELWRSGHLTFPLDRSIMTYHRLRIKLI